MKKAIRAAIGTAAALLLLALFILVGLYFTRIQSVASIRQMTHYSDGYNLYRMDIRYRYCLEDVIAYGITDDQSMVDAILQEALPLLPVSIKAPDFGCTAFTMIDREGRVFMGRNYDFRRDTSAMMVYCSPPDGYRSLAFAALDNVAANAPLQSLKSRFATLTAPFICLDGMNEKGVSIAVLTLDSEPTRQQTGKSVIAPTLAIRLVLDHAATTAEAIDLLRGYDMFASGGRDYHFFITDATGDSRVVEYDCNDPARPLIDTPSPAATNFYILYQDLVKPYQYNDIYGHGRERYDTVLDILQQQKDALSPLTVWEALQAAAQEPNPEDITSNTQWSICFNNTNLTAEVALRRHWDQIFRFCLMGNTIAPE